MITLASPCPRYSAVTKQILFFSFTLTCQERAVSTIHHGNSWVEQWLNRSFSGLRICQHTFSLNWPHARWAFSSSLSWTLTMTLTLKLRLTLKLTLTLTLKLPLILILIKIYLGSTDYPTFFSRLANFQKAPNLALQLILAVGMC